MGALGACVAALLVVSSPARALSARGHGGVAASCAATAFWKHTPRYAPTGIGAAASGAAYLASRLEDGAVLSLRLLRFGFGGRLPDDRAMLMRDQGRRVLNFPVRESAPGLFVHVSGEVEFERVDIGFADGSIENVDAFGVDRDSGLYELARFGNARSVDWVRLVLRARSRQARVGIKLAG